MMAFAVIMFNVLKVSAFHLYSKFLLIICFSCLMVGDCF